MRGGKGCHRLVCFKRKLRIWRARLRIPRPPLALSVLMQMYSLGSTRGVACGRSVYRFCLQLNGGRGGGGGGERVS